MLRIQSARITPSDLRQGRFQAEVKATFEDGRREVVLTYDDDELCFTEAEFVGLTKQEVGGLFLHKDVAYLRS